MSNKKRVDRETCVDCGAPLEPDHAPNKKFCPACERLHVRYTRYKAHCRHGVHPRTPVSFADWKIEHGEKYDAWKVGKRHSRREKEMKIQLPGTTLMPRACIQCGRDFIGGPGAQYCPDCRIERRRESAKESQRRRRAGKAIVLGETVGRCAVCGKKFVYKSANQKYCSACAPEAMAEHNRKSARGGFRRLVKKYGQQYGELFLAARRVDRTHCIDCGTPLAQGHGPNKIYCPDCEKLHVHYRNYKGYCKSTGRDPLCFKDWKAGQR